MKVLELFCGVGGWSKGFAEHGHECTGVDIEDLGYPFNFIKADLFDWEFDQKYDIVLASPPCANFSIVNYYFNGKCNAMKGLDLVWRTFDLIQRNKPKYWVIENVKGLSEFLDKPNEIIRYGKQKGRKEAYLWTNIGKLPMFMEQIFKNPVTKEVRNKRVGSPDLAEIPIQLSRAVHGVVCN